MNINGINLNELDAAIPETLMPALVKGRVLQLDGDCLAYECSAHDDEPLGKCTTNFKAALQSRMSMAGASCCVIHLTGGDKGGRFDIAMVKEYQANRKGKEKPTNLSGMRDFIMQTYAPERSKEGVTDDWIYAVMHEHQEADDGMTQGQYKIIVAGNPELSVIHTADKDLGMASGLHLDWNSYEMKRVDGFGYIELVEMGIKTKTKKIKGYGTSFFWAQLLCGDTADNIPGLPKVGMPMLDEVDPLKKPRKEDANSKLCGQVLAYNILKDATCDLDAFLKVVKAYSSYYGNVPFNYTTWRDDVIRVTSGHMVLEQAKLLWMRRTVDECPSVFFKQVANSIKWDGTNA